MIEQTTRRVTSGAPTRPRVLSEDPARETYRIGLPEAEQATHRAIERDCVVAVESQGYDVMIRMTDRSIRSLWPWG